MERTKVLFATAPFDGHFDPLTTLALALQQVGYDVRWYTQENYAPKLAKLQIPHFPFRNALQFHGGNIHETIPQRSSINFDLDEILIKRGPEYYEDLKEVYSIFPFDIMIADLGFTGIAYVRRLMQVPVISVNVFPLMESDPSLAPYGLGLPPADTYRDKIKLAALRFFDSRVLSKKVNNLNSQLFRSFGIESTGNFLDDAIYHSSIVLQRGTQGFEYRREKISEHIRFIGPLLPGGSGVWGRFPAFTDNSFERTVLVTHGTVEKDIDKFLVPALKAFRGSNTRVIATTGGHGTSELRRRFPEPNFLIEDFLPFSTVMPYCDAFVSNGGYGGVLHAIQNRLPIVLAGISDGRNEVSARVEYFGLGINLASETPFPGEIRNAVNTVTQNRKFIENVDSLADEFAEYDPVFLIKKYVYLLTQSHGIISKAA